MHFVAGIEIPVEHEHISPRRIVAQFTHFPVMIRLTGRHAELCGRIEHPLGIAKISQIQLERQLIVEFLCGNGVIQSEGCRGSLRSDSDQHIG